MFRLTIIVIFSEEASFTVIISIASDIHANYNHCKPFPFQARPLMNRALEDGNFDALVDPRMQNNYNHNEMARMVACAAACVRHSARRRPRMSQVIR